MNIGIDTAKYKKYISVSPHDNITNIISHITQQTPSNSPSIMRFA